METRSERNVRMNIIVSYICEIGGLVYSVYTAEMDQHKQQAALKFEEQLRHI
jgi:hypothetical protein